MIRKATQSDIPSILELYREQFREMERYIPDFIKEGNQSTEFLENTISNDNSDILVYEIDNKIIGFILLQEKIRSDFDFIVNAGTKSCYIMDLVVTEDSRNNGYGTELMNAAKDWAKERECIFINLDVLSKNTGAIKLYNKLGYTAKAQEMILKL